MTDGASQNAGFTNATLEFGAYPTIDRSTFQSLDQRLLTARVVGTLTFGLVLVGASAVLTFVLASQRWIGLTAMAISLASTLAAVTGTRVSFRHWGYLVRERDLTVSHGVMSRTVTTVSFNRVQHVAINSGPIERWLGLATLRVYTAGGVGAEVDIEGLSEAAAAGLQQLILANVAAAGQSTKRLD